MRKFKFESFARANNLSERFAVSLKIRDISNRILDGLKYLTLLFYTDYFILINSGANVLSEVVAGSLKIEMFQNYDPGWTIKNCV